MYEAKISSFSTFLGVGGGRVESEIQLISAKGEAKAWAELGNIQVLYIGKELENEMTELLK